MTVLLGLAALSSQMQPSMDDVQVFADGSALVIDGTNDSEQVLVYSTRTEWKIRVTQGSRVRSWSVPRSDTPDIVVNLHGGDDVFTALTDELTYRVDSGRGHDILVGAGPDFAVDGLMLGEGPSPALVEDSSSLTVGRL
ncbi:MAG: hypothetical protein ACJAZO_001585 [Myxococcota bacterium]|jgi:hypothetical protein